MFALINIPLNVVTIDWEKRNWKRILTPEEEREMTAKMLRLNGGPDYDPAVEGLLAASSIKKKPTVRIKLSNIQRQLLEQQKKKAEKALRLNGH